LGSASTTVHAAATEASRTAAELALSCRYPRCRAHEL